MVNTIRVSCFLGRLLLRLHLSSQHIPPNPNSQPTHLNLNPSIHRTCQRTLLSLNLNLSIRLVRLLMLRNSSSTHVLQVPSVLLVGLPLHVLRTTYALVNGIRSQGRLVHTYG